MISELLQKHMLKRRHEGHFMIEKSKRRVRDILHWPQTNSNIEELSRLVVYAKNTGVVKQNPMLVAEEKFSPWSRNLSTLAGKKRLCICPKLLVSLPSGSHTKRYYS